VQSHPAPPATVYINVIDNHLFGPVRPLTCPCRPARGQPVGPRQGGRAGLGADAAAAQAADSGRASGGRQQGGGPRGGFHPTLRAQPFQRAPLWPGSGPCRIGPGQPQLASRQGSRVGEGLRREPGRANQRAGRPGPVYALAGPRVATWARTRKRPASQDGTTRILESAVGVCQWAGLEPAWSASCQSAQRGTRRRAERAAVG
jgi:hypothetical protein